MVRLLLRDTSCLVAQQLEGLRLYSAIPSPSSRSRHDLVLPPGFQLLSPPQQPSAFPLKYSDATSSPLCDVNALNISSFIARSMLFLRDFYTKHA